MKIYKFYIYIGNIRKYINSKYIRNIWQLSVSFPADGIAPTPKTAHFEFTKLKMSLPSSKLCVEEYF